MALEREVEGDLFLQDIGQGFGFRPGTFDGAISISVLQWLMNADSNTHSPPQRLTRFFTTLHSALKNPSRAVFQFYPNSDDQVQLITQCAQRAGFGGGLVVDYPNSRKARKMYLCLMVGQQEIPKGIDGDEVEVDETQRRDQIRNERRRKREATRKKGKGSKGLTGKEWVLKKKELYRTRGKEAWVSVSHAQLLPVSRSKLTPAYHETPSILRASVASSSRYVSACLYYYSDLLAFPAMHVLRHFQGWACGGSGGSGNCDPRDPAAGGGGMDDEPCLNRDSFGSPRPTFLISRRPVHYSGHFSMPEAHSPTFQRALLVSTVVGEHDVSCLECGVCSGAHLLPSKDKRLFARLRPAPTSAHPVSPTPAPILYAFPLTPVRCGLRARGGPHVLPARYGQDARPELKGILGIGRLPGRVQRRRECGTR